MEKKYRFSPISLLFTIIKDIFAIGVVFIIVGYLFEIKAGIISSLVVGVLILKSIFDDLRTHVTVTDKELIIKENSKTFNYDLRKIKLGAKIKNNDNFKIIVQENDNIKNFDLSILGYYQFNELINDLGIIGDKSKIKKLDISE